MSVEAERCVRETAGTVPQTVEDSAASLHKTARIDEQRTANAYDLGSYRGLRACLKTARELRMRLHVTGHARIPDWKHTRLTIVRLPTNQSRAFPSTGTLTLSSQSRGETP